MNKFRIVLFLIFILLFSCPGQVFSDTATMTLNAIVVYDGESGHMTSENNIVVNSSRPTIVLAGNSPDTGFVSIITIPSSILATSSSYLDFRELILDSDGKNQITASNTIVITRDSSENDSFEMTITAGTILKDTDASWSGKFLLPTLKTDSSANLPTLNGDDAIVEKIIDIGTSTSLNTNNPIKIKIPNQADKKIGYVEGDSFTEIVNVCSDNINPAVFAGSGCKISVGDNLFVWMRHISEIVVYSYPVIAEEVEVITPSSGGGGSILVLKKEVSILINNGEKITNSRTVTLALDGGSDAKKMSISNINDFINLKKDTYTTKRTWLLSAGEGEKKVYVRFFNKDKSSSVIVKDSIILKYPILSGESKIADIDGDGVVGLLDFNLIMVNWDEVGENEADISNDGLVDIFDLNLIFVHWTM